MRVILAVFVSLFLFVSYSQSPQDVAKRIADRYINESKLELVRRPIAAEQQGVLVAYPQIFAGQTCEIEMIMTVSELGGRKLAFAANPGQVTIWLDGREIYNGTMQTATVPRSLESGLFTAEYEEVLPPFPADYQIRISYSPSTSSSAVFVWLTDHGGNIQESRSFRSDLDFFEPYPYRFRTLGAGNEEWKSPPFIDVLQHADVDGSTDWTPATGRFLDALFQASLHFADLDYESYLLKHLNFFAEAFATIEEEQSSLPVIDVPFYRFFRMQQLDDYGSQLGPYLHFPENETYRSLGMRGLNRMLYKNPRLQDGSYARYAPDSLTVWAEDLYMSTVLLSRAYSQTNRRAYLEEAIKQVILYDTKLKDRYSGLYWHGYSAPDEQPIFVKWARANGLALFAKVELLKAMPESHPDRESVLRIFRLHASNIREFQSDDGLWHQIMDDTSSYKETSASALFVASFAEGVANRWVFNSQEFRQAAVSGWLELVRRVDDSGNVTGIVEDSPVRKSDEFYQSLEHVRNHIEGLGPMLLACIAIDKLDK